MIISCILYSNHLISHLFECFFPHYNKNCHQCKQISIWCQQFLKWWQTTDIDEKTDRFNLLWLEAFKKCSELYRYVICQHIKNTFWWLQATFVDLIFIGLFVVIWNVVHSTCLNCCFFMINWNLTWEKIDFLKSFFSWEFSKHRRPIYDLSNS